MEELTAASLLPERSRVATKALVMSVFVSSVGAFNYGCVVAYSAPTQFGIMNDLGLSLAQFSFFGSILTIGGIIGAIASGKLTDLIGRLKTIWIIFILYISGWLVISFAQDAWLLDLGRFLHGVTTGIGSYLGPIYIAEITPSSHRGAVSSLSQMLSVFGISFVYIIGILVNWRSLALIGAATCVMSLPLLVFAVESPRWLAKNRRQKELEETLLLLRGGNADIREEAAEILECTKDVEHLPEDGILDLFQKKYLLSVMIGVVLTALPQLGGLNGYAFYTNSIFISAGVPSNTGFIATSVVQILGCIIGTILVDISGRRPLLLFSQVGSILGCLITGISFLLQDHHCWETGTPILALTSVLVYFGAYGLGMGSIPWIIASEIYPVNIKGAAGTICNLVNWTISGMVSYAFGFLLEWSPPGTFFIFAWVCGLGIVFTAKLVPETKGKTLEEIQASLTDLN